MRYSNFSKWWVRAQKEASTHLSDGYEFLLVWRGVRFGFIKICNREKRSLLSYRVWPDGYSVYKDGEWVAYRNEKGCSEIRHVIIEESNTHNDDPF